VINKILPSSLFGPLIPDLVLQLIFDLHSRFVNSRVSGSKPLFGPHFLKISYPVRVTVR
jgi:hypothetical protein